MRIFSKERINLQFTLDIHCHTVNSGHAYSTITENAAYAASIGLTHIGISDHAPAMPGGAHLYHFTNLWILPEIIHGVRVFKGVEVNISNLEGTMDLADEFLKKMDFVIASMHRGVFPPTDCDTHTRAAIAAMEHPHVHILGHPGDFWFEIDIEAVVKAAARTNTIIEINEKTLDPDSYRYVSEDLFVQMLKLCNELKVPVLASSDAHFSTLVGDYHRAKALIEKVGIDQDLVLNTSHEKLLAAIARKKVLTS